MQNFWEQLFYRTPPRSFLYGIIWHCQNSFEISTTHHSMQNFIDFGQFRSSHLQIFFKIDVLKISQYSQENTCAGKFYESFKNSFLIEHLWWLFWLIWLLYLTPNNYILYYFWKLMRRLHILYQGIHAFSWKLT